MWSNGRLARCNPMESSAATRPRNARRKLWSTCKRSATPLATSPTGDRFDHLTSSADHRIVAVAAGAGSVPMRRNGVGLAAATVPENIARQSEMRTRFTPTEIFRVPLANTGNSVPERRDLGRSRQGFRRHPGGRQSRRRRHCHRGQGSSILTMSAPRRLYASIRATHAGPRPARLPAFNVGHVRCHGHRVELTAVRQLSRGSAPRDSPHVVRSTALQPSPS